MRCLSRVRWLSGLAIACLMAVCLAAMSLTGQAPAGAAAGARTQVRAGSAAGSSPRQPKSSAYQVQATPKQPKSLATMTQPPSAAPGDARAMAAASAQAESTGKPAGVAALTTQTSTVTANPHGGFTLNESLLPVRVWQGGRWVAVDTSLRWSGGQVAPVAVPGSLTLSGGGGGPLAVLESGGRSVAVSWPGTLPEPVLTGSSATYRNVLPGVNLVMSASVTGVSEVLVVSNAAAARDPGLRALRLGVSGTGVRITRGPDGSVRAVEPGGVVAFSAAPPVMWDSAGAGAAARSPGAAQPPKAAASLSSSWAGPGARAHRAGVAMSLAGSGAQLTLVPSGSMLDSPATEFPVYIDPTWQTSTPSAANFDGVQQGSPCNDVPYYDNENDPANPDSLGVGYFPSSFGTCYGTQIAYYEMPVPSAVDHAVINLATFNAAEDYSASCSADHNVNLHSSGSISKSTDYAHQPSWGSTDVTQNGTGVPDTVDEPDNCDGSLDSTKNTEPYGFTITSLISSAANASPASPDVTVALTEDSQDSSGDSLKRFTNNPSMTIEYDIPPTQPVNLKVGDNSSDMQSCPTSGTSYPLLGANSGSDVDLTAQFSQADAENLTASFRYWIPSENQTSTSGDTVLSAVSVAGSKTDVTGPAALLPESAVSGLPDGTAIDVEVQSEDPADQHSPFSGTCEFEVYPTAPGPPAVTMTSAANPPMGTTATFTIAAGTGCTATDFRWSLDQEPPVGGGTEVAATGGSATVSIVVPSPGSHELFAYADCSNNPDVSNTASAPFTAGSDTPMTCTSFAAALANECSVTTEAFVDNTMLSGGSGTCNQPGGDGERNEIDYAQLVAQGWTPAGNVTVDGANFQLPDFGSCRTDNILSANQTIDMGGQGSALVFLATSANATAAVPPGGTGLPGSPYVSSETTAPPVPGGVAVTGQGCTQLLAFSGTNPGCSPAEGTITYGNGSTAPFWLTVPDWIAGPQDIAAISTADRDTPSGQQADSPKIYAFAVPLNPGETLQSVTLPDVGDTVVETGETTPPASLHIFGISVRNTTTDTPEINGTGAAVPSGQAWTGAFESPTEAAWGPVSGGVSNQTIRIAASPDINAAEGTQVRIRLSDPGFLSADGDGPILIGDATITTQSSGATPGPAPVQMTFGGQKAVTIPAGGDVYTDPLTLSSFGITAGQNLLISLYVENGDTATTTLPALTYLPGLSAPSGASEWESAPGSGDQTSATSTSAAEFPDSSWTLTSSLLTGVDVTTPAATIGGVTSPGAPTVVVAGNNVADPYASGNAVAPDSGAPSFRIAGQLATAIPAGQSTPTGSGFGLVDAGIESNQAQADSSPTGGVSLLNRIDRDVLAEPDTGTVIIDEGLEDLLKGASGDAVTSAYGQLDNILNGFGITVVFATLTPCGNYAGTGSPADSCPSGGTADSARQDVVNTWVGNPPPPIVAPYTLEADFDCQISNQAPTCQGDELLQSADGGVAPPGGDWVNLTTAGYAAAAQAVTPADLYPVQFPAG